MVNLHSEMLLHFLEVEYFDIKHLRQGNDLIHSDMLLSLFG